MYLHDERNNILKISNWPFTIIRNNNIIIIDNKNKKQEQNLL